MTEEYFPRGGKKPNVTYFKQSSNFLGAAEKGQGKKKKQKKKSENDDGYLSDEAVKEVDQSYKMCAAGIGQKTIKPGVNILGRVRRALDTKLLVSLPSKLDGTVMACHVSQAYNKLLEAYVNDEMEKVRDLGDMFRPGQYLAVHVLEADASGESMLSAMPQHVNGARTHADLKKGDILQAAVSSVEDHGYVMDLGIANTTAFLAKADANPDIELEAGVLIWTCVKSHTANADSSIVALSGALPALQKALRRKRGALQPGAAVEFLVDKPLDNGIEGRVFGDTTAYIQRFHADNSKGKKPALGQKLRAHVLYVMPTRNQPFLTTRDIFRASYPDLSEEMLFKEGDIIEGAQVLKIASRSIHFKLGKRCVGTMSLKRLAVDEDLSDEQVIALSYPIGSTHRVRVLTYNMSDYIYHVSDQPSVLSERYFSLEQLPAGARAVGTVRAVADRFISVGIGRLSGVVMQTHLSDAGVYVDPKKATASNLTKKKYKVGQEISVRVLSCDPARQNLQLTLKPSLLAEDIEVLASYDQAEVGKSYTGFIKVVKDYVLVGFFNNVVAYVPVNQVCHPPVEVLVDSFHPGQIVNCTIMRVDKEQKKMNGSLITPPFWPAAKPPYLGKRKNESEDTESSESPKKKRKSNEDTAEDTEESGEPKRKNFLKILQSALQEEGSDGLASYEQAEIGKSYTGFVKVNCTIMRVDKEQKKMNGSLITPPFLPAAKPPYVGKPKNESEDTESSESPKKKRKSNEDTAEDTEESGEPKRKNFLKILQSALQEEGSDGLASYEQAEIGKSYTGFVKVVKDYLLVGFLGGVVAYVPRSHASDPPVETLSDIFQLGQIVNCTIMRVEKEQKKMNGSLIIPPFLPAAKPPYVGKPKNESEDTESSESPKKKRKSNEDTAEDTEESGEPKRKNFLKILQSALQEEGSDGLASYEQAEIGKSYTGFVKVVKDYLLVGFLGGVVAYVPRSHASDPPVETLSDIFQLGQIVNCTIMRVEKEQKKMNGSLITPPFLPAAKPPYVGKPKNESEDTESSESPKKKRKSNEDTAEETEESGEPKRKNFLKILQSALQEEGSDGLASYEQAEIGKSYTGFVKVVKDYLLVGFLGGVVAYVPRSHASDPPVETLSDIFQLGQIVNCTIMRVEKEQKKMNGSLITPPFWPAERKLNEDTAEDTEESDEPKRKNFLKILQSALQEEGSDGLASYEQAEIGKSYTGFVKVVKDYLLVGFLGGVVAYVPRSHASDPPVETLSDIFQLGQIVKCTILQFTPAEKRMLGSLIIPPFWPAEKAPRTGKRNNETKDGEVPKRKRKLSDEDTDGKKKKDNNNKKVSEVSEESDAIETDIYEDSDQVLTPEDKALIDLSNCETLKQWRKRVESLGNFIKGRLRRIEKVEKKIVKIEEKGLTAENKKYHTDMHQEILVIKERLEKLVEALEIAQEKLSELEEESGDPETHKKKMAEINKLKAMIVKKDEPTQEDNKKKKKKKGKLEETITDEIEAEVKSKKVKVKVKKDKEVTVDKSKEIKVVESLEPALEVPSAKDFWSENADNLAKNVQEESSSSSEDEEKEQPKKKRKKLSAAEKDAKARAEEERLRELERRAADDSQPRSSDQFERALLANPNCSQLWVAYMAFHLQATEIDKARAVGRRALNTISFREEDEKLNVWLAMLNFEHRFGTQESQQKTLEDALQMNDTFKIHSKLLDILVDTSKPQELSTLVDLMMKKYKRDPRCYILCGQACFKTGLVDKARHVMQKAISVLEKKEHVSVLVQFALLERASGSRERAEALFEQVLAVYPQRVDVCAAYADMLAKAADMEQLRQVMERMTSHKLPARKIKVLYNKWIELEERAGNTEKAEQIRERALQFIEKAKF